METPLDLATRVVEKPNEDADPSLVLQFRDTDAHGLLYLFSVPNAVGPRFLDRQSGTRSIQVMFTPPLCARAYSAARRKLLR